MTRQGTLFAVLGLFVLFGALMPAPALAAGWADSAYYDQASFGQGHSHSPGHDSHGGLFHFNPTTAKIAKIGLSAAGSIVAGLFGSQFGTVGTVVGGAAGFFVSKWIGDKLFGSNSYPQQYNEGQGFFSKIKDKILGRDHGSYPPVYGNDPYQGGNRWSKIRPMDNGNLAGARQDFYRTMEDYKRALTSGSQAEKETAKAAYDAARNTFFSAKGGNQ